jgi:hypothetical protein
MVAHRRAGKTVACVNELVARAAYSRKKRSRYGYFAPLLKQAKKISWEYLKEYTKNLSDKVSESELTVRLRHNGAEVSIYGADNPDSFRGLYFDGVVLDEYGDMHPGIWTKVILPALSDRRGWAVFIGTPRGKNHFYKVWKESNEKPNWWRFILRARESGILPPEELELIQGEQTEDEYLQEYECSFDAAVVGTYYSKIISKLESSGQIYSDTAEFDDSSPVQVVSDLGYTDSTSLWFFQERVDGIALIDYEEHHSQGLDFYYTLLGAKPYTYSRFWVPHDAKAKTLASKRSVIEQLSDAFEGVLKNKKSEDRVVRLVPNLGVNDGINAARLLLPSCYFHSRTAEGVEALRAYRREFDEERKVFRDNPLHDWSSHGSDAFRYLCLVANKRIVSEPEVQAAKSESMTLEGLYEERGRYLSLARRRGW